MSFQRATNQLKKGIYYVNDIQAQHLLYILSGSGIIPGMYCAKLVVCKGTTTYKSLNGLAEASMNKVIHDLAEDWNETPQFVEIWNANTFHAMGKVTSHLTLIYMQ